jgi:acetylornithine deacetylase
MAPNSTDRFLVTGGLGCIGAWVAHERAVSGTPLDGPATRHGFAGVCDATWYEQKGIPSVVYGPGDLRLAHAANESVSVDETIAACKAFALLAMDWCGVDEG